MKIWSGNPLVFVYKLSKAAVLVFLFCVVLTLGQPKQLMLCSIFLLLFTISWFSVRLVLKVPDYDDQDILLELGFSFMNLYEIREKMAQRKGVDILDEAYFEKLPSRLWLNVQLKELVKSGQVEEQETKVTFPFLHSEYSYRLKRLT